MNVTWVASFPTGHEEGRYITLDLGGTYLRFCDVVLSVGKNESETFQQKYRLPGPIRTSPADDLWDFAADCLGSFMHEHHQGVRIPTNCPWRFAFPTLSSKRTSNRASCSGGPRISVFRG